MIRLPAGTEMTAEVLADVISKHKTEVNNRYQALHDAYVSDYEIYHQAKKPDWKPDNRIGVNFAKYITDTATGFFVGIPVSTMSSDEEVNTYVQKVLAYNLSEDEDVELAKISSIYGSAYEMYYVDEAGEIAMTVLSPMDSFIVYDDSVLERPMFFIRYYRDSNNKEVGSYSDSRIVRHFELKGSYVFTGEETLHGFDGVPAVEFVENTERLGTFESVLPMIDHYNKALSEKANDVDYFADAYLKILGAHVDDSEVKTIRDDRVIAYDGDNGTLPQVDFLAKPNADTTQENLLSRLERLIFEVSMVANVSDVNFGTASGIAIKYKLWSMSSMTRIKQNKFIAGFNNRFQLIFSNAANSIDPEAWTTLKYVFTQNYPANLSDEVEIAKGLQGIVSEETQLSVLSIVDDPKAEMEKKAEETPADMMGFTNGMVG